MRFLLDTNIVSDLIRNPQGRIAKRIGSVGEENIVLALLSQQSCAMGPRKKASPKLTAQVEVVLEAIENAGGRCSCRRNLRGDPRAARIGGHSDRW